MKQQASPVNDSDVAGLRAKDLLKWISCVFVGYCQEPNG